MNGITEYHTCDTCEFKFSVPTRENLSKWELACSQRRKYINSSGGLTRCPYWKEAI